MCSGLDALPTRHELRGTGLSFEGLVTARACYPCPAVSVLRCP